eukprot:m.243693 g.243693  ORF g.243693 m.243693 type:complete len:563 (-) comp19460_c0_seq1:2534-4222(-)
MGDVLNINVGVLGHVDSGKTSLARALSTVASTNAFDKNPQSKERGITLDLGFSSFQVPIPEHIKDKCTHSTLQFTLVDCPGHASLIRTIIGGAQIIDLMILVIDITKGIQTQTAECLVIGEITTKTLIVVLNKIDMLPAAEREKQSAKTINKLKKVFAKTKFKTPDMICVAAKPGGPESDAPAEGLQELMATLQAKVAVPERDVSGPLLFAVDHCFSIKGQGTVLTGTVLRGTVKVGDDIELPMQQLSRKVKSMQMFRKPVGQASMGDRLGMCVTSLDAKTLERGVLCKPGSLPAVAAAVARVEKIRFYKSAVKTKAKFHVSVGHDTVMATVTFFGSDDNAKFALGSEYHFLDELSVAGADGSTDGTSTPSYQHQYVLLEFDSKVNCSTDSLIIGSKLDTDIHTSHCRLAFSGRLVYHTTDASFRTSVLPQIKIFKPKVRTGVVDRLHDEYHVIGRALFSKETAMDKFLGLKVSLSTGEHGVIDSAFGKSGKFKVRVPNGLDASTVAALKLQGGGKKGKGKSTDDDNDGADSAAPDSTRISISLEFKRYIFDTDKKTLQQSA